MPKPKTGPTSPASEPATSGDVAQLDLRARVEHWGGGVVKVELTDKDRALFAAVAHDAARIWIDGMLAEDPSALSDKAVRLQAVLSTPRTRLPIWESLGKGAKGHGSRTTTFRLYLCGAIQWAEYLVCEICEGGELAGLERPVRDRLARVASRLMLASFPRRNGRPPTVDTEEAVRLLRAAKRRGGGAVKAAAARLGCDERAVGRALKRQERERSSLARARTLIEQVATSQPRTAPRTPGVDGS